ncbi:hypothetical protein V8E55_008343 [Tylopilus felleus]
MSTGVASGVPFNVKQSAPAWNNAHGTPVKPPAQTTPGKSAGRATPAKSPKVSRTPERSPQAQSTPSTSRLLFVEKGQRRGFAASVVDGGGQETVAVLSNQVNDAPTLVNAESLLGGYSWDDHDVDDISFEMLFEGTLNNLRKIHLTRLTSYKHLLELAQASSAAQAHALQAELSILKGQMESNN